VVAGAAGAAAAAMAVAIKAVGAAPMAAAGTVAIAVAVAMTAAGLSAYVSLRALAGDKKNALIRAIAIAFAGKGGTSFRGADLTDADFTQATLESTNFRRANLTGTCWFQAKKLEIARLGRTYLENPQVRQLVITKQGQNQNFDNLPMGGLNLSGANLVDASFVGTDLTEANLQNANLLRANLKQTQLDRTDLTGACLIEACFEDCGITSETKLDSGQRQYIFRRLAKKRRPQPEPPSPT